MQIIVLAIVVILSASVNTVHAINTDAQLRILPMNCVFEVVNDGSNELRYITPAACGQLVESLLPVQPQSPVTILLSNEPDLTIIEPVPVQIITLPMLLNDFEEFEKEEGKEIAMEVNQRIEFIIATTGGNNGTSGIKTERHSVTIKAITEDYVIITIASKPFDAKLFVGETRRYDITEDGKNDIEIKLNHITSNVADLTFRRLDTISTNQPSVEPDNDTNKLLVLLLATMLFMAFFARKKRTHGHFI